MIPVLQERAKKWDAFVRIRDEAEIKLGILRKSLGKVLAKPRRSTNDVKKDFDVISGKRKSYIVCQFQQFAELFDPHESVYTDLLFMGLDAEEMEKQYDDVLNKMLSEIEDENLLCGAVDHSNTKMNSIFDLLSREPTKENIENVEQFQLPALRAQLAILKEKYDEASHARKHVDPDSSRFAALEDRMKSLDSMLENAKKTVENHEQERIPITAQL
ncbi:unnamed protein product [Cylicostephanus goldi]|uniref:Nuclear anchorage protein 1 spectrin-like repeat domain-containing protein n=1 Tax=Cylicostephanus goldi TaxID=71465 RepID=A0A3P7MIC1_CYLGO|nr:unnamed protein product [Cylicostephanus goldi]